MLFLALKITEMMFLESQKYKKICCFNLFKNWWEMLPTASNFSKIASSKFKIFQKFWLWFPVIKNSWIFSTGL